MEQIRSTPPPIVISSEDYDRLSALVNSRQASAFWPGLVDALNRADIVERDEVSPGTVIMGTELEYADSESGETRRVTLVYPQQEDSEAGRISVLTPVGAALIGLSVGQAATWQTRGGAWKSLTVTRVLPAAEAEA